MNFVDNTTDMPWRNFSSQGRKFGTELQREIPLFLEIPELPYSTVKGSFHIKTSMTRLVVLI